MKRSMYRYMLFDLVAITLIGCVLEALVTMMSGVVFTGAPTITFGLLIVTIAVIRWHFWGLITIPFVSLATVIGGHFNQVVFFSAMYDWRILLSVSIGLLVFAINAVIYKKFGTKNVVKNLWLLIPMMVADYLLFTFVQMFVYNLITSGNPFKVGEILLTYNTYIKNDDGTTEVVKKVANLCAYTQNEFIYNLFGLRILIVGGLILRSQGVLTNAYEKLVDDKEMAELDRMDAENFSIEDVEEAKDDSTKLESDETQAK